MIQHAKQNLNELSAELLHSCVHETALPALLDERRAELADELFAMDQLLCENQLAKVSMSTTHRWMKQLGFKHEVRRKCHCVDDHEKPETKKHRKTMVSQHLKNKLCMHGWIQSPLTELKDLEEQLQIFVGDGHHCTDPETSVEMVELHVDSHPTFHETMNARTQFGGNLSFRMPPNAKPLICWGQDERVFKQFLFTGETWTCADGQRPVIPKDEGLGAMTLAFVSREFGFGMKVSDEELQMVNACRVGKNCSNKAAALERRGTIEKKQLENSPFVAKFDNGVNADGCWT
jgi:hypothetical protein